MRFNWNDALVRLAVLFLSIALLAYIITNVIPFLQGKKCVELGKTRYGTDTLLRCAKWS
jgi:hypothetical protein